MTIAAGIIAAAEPINPLDFAEVWDAYSETLLGWLLNLAAAAAILIVGLWVAGAIRGFICRRVDSNPRIDQTLAVFFSNIAYYALVAFVLIAVLGRFGVQTTSLVAVLGAATLAIGLALQGTLGNVAAGVMVIVFRPYKLGDFVEAGGQSGTVKNITLFSTKLNTPDNIQIFVPNSNCWGDAIKNYSGHPIRRCDLTFGISYDDDIDKAIETVLGVVRADERFLNEPAEPWVRVINLGDSSVDLQLRAWAKSGDFWEARFATLKAVKEAFDANGIEIPYPHQVEIQKKAEE